MDDYTPTTEEVATYYGMGWFAEEDAEVQGNPVTNFERWLSAHDAEVEARGARAGYDAGYTNGRYDQVDLEGGIRPSRIEFDASLVADVRAQQVREGKLLD